MFRNAMVSGANNIFKNRVHVNELNIFPVPDGDTGTNMSVTISNAVKKIENINCIGKNISEIALILSSAALREARGNSGVILSLILRGFAQGFENLEKADEEDLLRALGMGVKNAYEAVAKPTEGTMLTVARVAFEKGHEFFYGDCCNGSAKEEESGGGGLVFNEFKKTKESLRGAFSKGKQILENVIDFLENKKEEIISKIDLEFNSENKRPKDDVKKNIKDNMSENLLWESVCSGAREALAQTPELLPVLKKAGVIDAGGKGLCLIFEGMLSVFKNGEIIEREAHVLNISDDDVLKAASRDFEGNINFTYCTEYILSKHINSRFDLTKFRALLEKIGDCVVVVEDKEIVKVHVHTNFPDKALTRGLKFGRLITVKIENMEEQRKTAMESASVSESEKIILNFSEVKEKKFGIIAVACGEGVINAFKELGCDAVVTGGQTMNPSAREIAEAARLVPADVVYILTNNKNTIMAAEQAVQLTENRKLTVIKSRNIPQGMAAILSYDPENSEERNFTAMNAAMEKIRSGQITYAARDSEFNGFKIKKGDVLAFDEGKLIFLKTDYIQAALKLTEKMVDKNTAFITIICGRGITESESEKIKNLVAEKFPCTEISLIKNGGDAYYFIISLEC
jgi:DAK2 domain fusion protein YloV